MPNFIDLLLRTCNQVLMSVHYKGHTFYPFWGADFVFNTLEANLTKKLPNETFMKLDHKFEEYREIADV